MGLDYSYLRGGGSTGSGLKAYKPSFEFDSGPSLQGPAGMRHLPSGALSPNEDMGPLSGQSKKRGVPERVGLDQFFGPDEYFGSVFDKPSALSAQQDTGTLRAIEALALAPGRVQEMPVSTATTLVDPLWDAFKGVPFLGDALRDFEEQAEPFLSRMQPLHGTDGKSRVRQSLMEAGFERLGQVPIIGDVGRGIGEILEESSKVGPAVINAGDLDRLRRLRGKPDDALLRDVEPGFWLSGLGSPGPQGLLSPLARLMDLNTTVGEFRLEMAKRGFTPDEVAVLDEDPGFLGLNSLNYGDHPSSSNPLLAIGQSIALDPTNLAFVLGPARIAKVGAQLAGAGLTPVRWGIGLLPKMETAGLIARVAPDAVTSARAMMEGNAALATMKGWGHAITNTLAHPERVTRPYTALSLGNTAAVVGLDATTDWLDEALPDDFAGMPLIRGMQDLAQSIRDAKPLSEGATWNLVSAFHFPIRSFVPGTMTMVRKAAHVGDGAEGYLAERLGQGKSHTDRLADFQQRIGGLPGSATLVNYIDKQIAFKRMNPRTKQEIASYDSAAQRNVILNRELDFLVADLRKDAKITNAERFQVFKDWFGEQSGAGRTGVRQEWDPKRALDHWTQTWIPMQRQFGTVASARGEAVIGFTRTLSKENISDITDALRLRVVDGRVPVQALRDIFERYPQLLGGRKSSKFFARKGEKQSSTMAEFLVKDAEAPNWEYVRDEFSRAKRRAPTAAELTHELSAIERRMAKHPKAPAKTTGGHREITQDIEQDVLGARSGDGSLLSEARIPTPEDLAPVRAAQDAAQGSDVAFNQARDAEVVADLSPGDVDWFGRTMSASAREELEALRGDLEAAYPGYTLKPPPRLAVIMSQAEIEAPQIATQIMRMNGLQESLRYFGPLSGAGRALEFLLAPVSGSTMRENARQAILNYALPRKATPEQIDRIIAELAQDANKQASRFRSVKMGAPWELLKPNNIEIVAQKHLSAEAYAVIKKDFGGFTRLIDRSFNRVIQKAHGADGAVTGRLGRALETVYGTWQNTAGMPLRHVKAFYPIFRFAMSPRYWAMNLLEANILGLVKYGSGIADKRTGVAALIHEGKKTPRQRLVDEAALTAAADSGQPLVGRHLAGYISKNFDGMTMESVQELIDNLPRNSREHAALVDRFGPNEGTWSEQLNAMLYNFDNLGVKRTIDDTARVLYTPEQIREMAPVLQRLYEINDKHYKAIVNTLEGNHSRPNIERILNSYFLYWPLTYQLKAGKWLFDVMTERAFGRKTNFAGAYTVQNLVDTHKEKLATDPEYGKMFEDNSTLFFAAQMMFPITPFDVGVALNRGVRYAGGALGWWGAYKESSDPLSAAEAMLTLGPIYDIQLLRRIWSETKGKEPKPEPKPRARPYPAQFVPPTSSPGLIAPAPSGG